MELANASLWGAFFAIVAANILLSGDNAVVIAMAARSLPAEQQKKAVFWGSAAAIIMRVVLTVVAVQLLQVPYLKVIGGVLLLWIGIQLLVYSDDEGDIKSHGTIGAAIRTILIADLVMSVDNVLAVAGAADRAPEQYRLMLLIIGLALSIPLIIAGSTLLMKIMDRFPIIITLGAALLGFLAGEMFVSDPATKAWFHANIPEADFVMGGGCAVLVVVIGLWLARRQHGDKRVSRAA
jgi:YjbE family integral membrane protein